MNNILQRTTTTICLLSIMILAVTSGSGLMSMTSSKWSESFISAVQAASCTNNARFVADVTIPDNTLVGSGQTFVKTWRIRNTGTCTWDKSYKLVYASGERMGASTSQILSKQVAPNGEYAVSITFKAPTAPGTYRSAWQMGTGNGKRFGSQFFVQIAVPVSAPATILSDQLGLAGFGSTALRSSGGLIYKYLIENPGPPFVHIEAGWFQIGSGDYGTSSEINYYFENAQPQHRVYLDSYWIMKTEVTNAMWQQFIADSGYNNLKYWSEQGWTWRTQNSITAPRCWDESNLTNPVQPVVCVSWYEAEAFARWAGVVTGQDIRLPTEAQWEKAARGTDGRIYPWGNDWDDVKRFNYCDTGSQCGSNPGADGYLYTAPVGSYPNGASPYGVLDMAGNALEWTADWYNDRYYVASVSENPTSPTTGSERVIRGGSYRSNPLDARVDFRRSRGPDRAGDELGFRLVSSSDPYAQPATVTPPKSEWITCSQAPDYGAMNVFARQFAGAPTIVEQGKAYWIRMSIGFKNKEDAQADYDNISLVVSMNDTDLASPGGKLIEYNKGGNFWEINSYHCTGELAPGEYTIVGTSYNNGSRVDSARFTLIAK